MATVTDQSWLARLGQYHPRLIEAAVAMNEADIPRAEFLLRTHLKEDPFEVSAIRMLAEVAGRIGRYRDSEKLLRRALELSPAFTAARATLALVLYRQNRSEEAIAELDRVLAEEPDNPGHANLKAAAFGRIGEFEGAITLYEQVLAQAPNQPRVWMSFGHMLKTVGRLEEGIAAYRKAIALMPTLGEAWWSLANLKTVKFSDADIAAMEDALAGGEVAVEDRFHLDFALGKALEDRGEVAGSFAHYASGNALRRQQIGYDPQEVEHLVDQLIEIATPEFFAQRAGQGCDATDPIFVLGMPRAGSTLVEQILASHSLIEGTTELPDIPALARMDARFPHNLPELTAEQMARQGDEFLRRSRIQRKTDRPFFIDKGQAFSYSLDDMGRYYRDYVRLMAHLDRVQPGKVHRVVYERMVDDTEAEVRALLGYCGVEFEPACLAFHQTERAVRTPSSEQVRQPIFRDGTEAWKPFSEYLDPLRAALGDVIDCYPQAPPAL